MLLLPQVRVWCALRRRVAALEHGHRLEDDHVARFHLAISLQEAEKGAQASRLAATLLKLPAFRKALVETALRQLIDRHLTNILAHLLRLLVLEGPRGFLTPQSRQLVFCNLLELIFCNFALVRRLVDLALSVSKVLQERGLLCRSLTDRDVLCVTVISLQGQQANIATSLEPRWLH